ncbi:ImmA/IrrE family metallo-endopeptidase [Heliorestis convoluta]|uniref:Zn peptidase n=1 Tax=Heliorestis convoluta TaxID=356322 RepID=A0A5Q2N1E8_9FIRM|nr:ImmA/IrrE family metallo-endopeptidase [Heliorestis convoluta]QGG47416.1 Putative Zn peptidase [Heliorestis convoluta]
MNKNRQLAIEKIADTVRAECKVTGYGFQNIFEAAEKLGYQVIRYPIGKDEFLGFAMIKEGERIVFSNSSLILSREIFSIAHELGHQKLHLSEQGLTLIKDDDFTNRDEYEVEANYFAASLMMPREKVDKFIRQELNDKSSDKWNGLDIARIQTAFNVSYDMALIRLKALGKLSESQVHYLKNEKGEYTATKLLKAISGNVDLCRSTEAKKVPAEYLEWVISNYNEKLIPRKSLQAALSYVDLDVEDIGGLSEEKDVEDDSVFAKIGT